MCKVLVAQDSTVNSEHGISHVWHHSLISIPICVLFPCAVSFGPAAVSFAVGILRRVLRLGGSGRARPQLQTPPDDDDPQSLLGPWERKIIAKYGAQAAQAQKPQVNASQ